MISLKSNFPPKTTHEREIDILLNAIGSVVLDHTGVYVSTPITSGRRFANWLNGRDLEVDLSHPETYQEFLREVLKPNSEHARRIIKKLRSEFPQALIDPTALKDIEGWVQDDYRYLWGKVIEQYVATVVFLDGWQFSNGCAYEFFVANRLVPRPSVLRETLEPLTREEGLDLIKTAVLELKSSGLATDFLERVAGKLAKLNLVEEVCADA